MKTTRRFFVAAAGAVSGSVLIPFGGSRAAASDSAQAGRDAGPRPDAGTPAPGPGAMGQVARERYGKFLDDKQLKLLDAKMSDVEARSKRLHAVKLRNSDEPACEFRAVRP